MKDKVAYNKDNGKFTWLTGRRAGIGSFKTAEEAHKAYINRKEELHKAYKESI